MNFIYDILINLQSNLYDFFEWNISDEILHIRKIPLLKINTDELQKIVNNIVVLDKETLNRINNRTEIFLDKGVSIIKYMCLLSDDKRVVAVEFDESGKRIRISNLLVDEEVEVLDVSDNIDCIPIKFSVIEERTHKSFKTRRELKIYDYIKKQFISDNYSKLRYLYFECFDKEEIDYSKIISRLNDELENNWDNTYDKIYKILKMSSQKQ